MKAFHLARPFSLSIKRRFPQYLSQSFLYSARQPRIYTQTSRTLQCTRIQSFATIMDSKVRRITDDLEKPDLDDRSYRVIELANKLEALLVHDPQTDKASASLCVNVGNFSDDDDMPGMAHAVEHLLFMGTEKVGKDLQNWITELNMCSILSKMNTLPTSPQTLAIVTLTQPPLIPTTTSNVQPRTSHLPRPAMESMVWRMVQAMEG